MEPMECWILCDSLTVTQATMLIIDLDPIVYKEYKSYLKKISDNTSYELEHLGTAPSKDVSDKFTNETEKWVPKFEAVFTALTHAIVEKDLNSKIIMTVEDKFNAIAEEYCEVETDQPDWEKSTVSVKNLKSWLQSHGIKSGFFFPGATERPDYLDSSHKHYSSKLAAAIESWQAVNANPQLTTGKTVKHALLKWLQLNSGKYGLLKGDGSQNKQGIEEIAKIANWGSKGGAPKTPE